MRKIFTRDFILSFLAQFFLSFVYCLLIPTIPIYLSRLGAGEGEIGILVGALSVSSLIFRPVVGRTLLRTTEKRCMTVGISLFLLSSFAYLTAPPFWPFLVVRILQGIGVAFFYTASFTLVANTTAEAFRGQSLSYFYLSINVAFAIAPYLGMLLINVLSFNVLFLLCGLLSFCSFLFTAKLTSRPIDEAGSLSLKGQPFIHRKSLPSAFMAFLVNIVWGALTAFFPLYALSHGISNPGIFFAVFAAFMILTRTTCAKAIDLYSREKVILPCIIVFIGAMALLAFSTTLSMFILVAALWGVGNGFLYPALVVHALDRAGSHRGLALGTFSAVADLGAGMGSVIMGFVLVWTNYQTMFLSLAVVGLINLLYFLFYVRKH